MHVMVSQESENRPKEPFKACPWWVRVSIRPDGLIMAYCSYDEAVKKSATNRGFEGPPKSEDCHLGYSEDDARNNPSIILYNQRTGQNRFIEVYNRVTSKLWGKMTKLFFDYSYPDVKNGDQLALLASEIEDVLNR